MLELMLDDQRPKLAPRSAGTRCPYCHDALAADERQERCAACLAGHHPECFSAHGGCSACNNSAGPAEDVQVVWEGGLQMLTSPYTSAFLWEPAASGRGLINLAYLLIVIGIIAILAARSASFSVSLPLAIVLVAFAPLLLRLHSRRDQRRGHISMDDRGLAIGAPWGRVEQLPWSAIKGFSIKRRWGLSEVFVEGEARRRLAQFTSQAAAERLRAELRRGLARSVGESQISP